MSIFLKLTSEINLLSTANQCYQPPINYAINLFHTLAELGWSVVAQLVFFMINSSANDPNGTKIHSSMKKLREKRIRWYDRVIRAEENSQAKISLNIKVGGKRPKAWPGQRWLDMVDGYMRISRFSDQGYDPKEWGIQSKSGNRKLDVLCIS